MKVKLVGAGPYDFGLLTIKGLEAIKEADVIIYDRLANSEFLNLATENCEKIDVGKSCNKHTLPQKEINKLILEKALLGKNVVRLKGGDPFLFGRGAEELELLKENNIPFEVIPGITSAISVPAYAGIPVTDRNNSSSLHIFTGHSKKNEVDIDFETIAKLEGTLIFLMSKNSILKIADGLIKAGMNPNTPTAIIENGTTPKQRKFIAELNSIARVSDENKILSPAILVVGKVCLLADRYDWFSKKPLFGTKVLITSHSESNDKLKYKLIAEGADVKCCPCIKTNPLKVELDFSDKYEWLIFSSKQGVKYFFQSMAENKIDIRKLSNYKIAAVGAETADELDRFSIYADFVPDEYNAESLANALIKQITKQVLIIKAKVGTKAITEIFQRENIKYKEISIYETEFIERKIIETDIDYVMFTSASTVHGFIKNLNNIDYLQNIKAICIGESTANAAREYGIKTFISEEATYDSMITLIKELKMHDTQTKAN